MMPEAERLWLHVRDLLPTAHDVVSVRAADLVSVLTELDRLARITSRSTEAAGVPSRGSAGPDDWAELGIGR